MSELWSPEWKQEKLDSLQEEWSECEACGLCEHRTNIVFGEGNPDADVMFIGEAPGEKEDESGLPFAEKGKSGNLFNNLLAALDRNRSDYYVTNVVACRPPKNRNPYGEEKNACMPRLHELIYIVDPLIIVPIGKYALNALVGGRDWGIERTHGSVFSSPHPSVRVTGEANGIEIPGKFFPKTANRLTRRLDYEAIPLFHPAYVLRVDSVDPQTNEFEEGGLANQTVEDLETIFNRLEEIKGEHEKVKRLLNRR
jgi:DNA polymerase